MEIFNGNFLGAADLPASVLNYKVPGAASSTSFTAPVSFWDKLNTALTKVGTTVEKVAPIVTTIKTTTGSGSTTANQGINTLYAGAQTPAVKPGLSTGAKVGIGVAAAAVVTGIIYAVTRKKKK